MLLFDIGANRGDATLAGLRKGYKVVAVEAAPRIYSELVKNFIYNPNVTPLRYAVSSKDNERVSFYECEEDGLSTLNLDWLTDEAMPYAGKPYRTVSVNTVTINTLVKTYGVPDLIKVDVEGAEWSVFHGMNQNYGTLAFEWSFATLSEHEKQLDYLYLLGYREVAPQYIVHHLEEPKEWVSLYSNNAKQLLAWHQMTSDQWITQDWQEAGLRPTADVGMLWVR